MGGTFSMRRTLSIIGAAVGGLGLVVTGSGSSLAAGTGVIHVPTDFVSTLSDTRSTGHYAVVGSGLRVWTEGNTSSDKVAEYVATSTPLATVGEPSLELTNNSGTVPPGFQQVVDFDGNGTLDGILVGEPTYYGNDWWASNSSAQFVKDGAPSHTGGSGSANHGTLDEWRTAFPNAVVKDFGFSLGSGVQGDWVINAVNFADTHYSFAAAPRTLIVGNASSCPGATYSTINSAIAAASSGDTIQVCAGTYFERVDVNKPGLTFRGAQAGVDARDKRTGPATVVTNHNGDFVLEGNADNTTIDGFELIGATDIAADAVQAFQGSSGLTLVNNLIQANANGMNFQNPDGSKPALIQYNKLVRNSFNANNPAAGGNVGSGIFISNGPANNTQIVENSFSLHTQTAINFAGDGNNPSVGLVVSENKSFDDSTFVVATNSSRALIDHNVITTHDAKVPYGFGHGTGILDFGGNSDLRIVSNSLKAVGNANQSSGISIANWSPSSSNTNVIANTVSGFYNGVKVTSGNRTAYVADNKLQTLDNDGIIVQPDVSGVVFSHNTVARAGHFACEDPTTGAGTAGTANFWRVNRGGTTPSSPQAICTYTP